MPDSDVIFVRCAFRVPALMNAQRYLVNGKVYKADDPQLQEVLGRIHGTPLRPRCLCVEGGVEMYVSKFDEFIVKRMPERGVEHSPTCPSYDLPSESDERLRGDAIIDLGPEGVEVRLAFPLTRYRVRGRRVGLPSAAEDVNAEQQQLSLGGMLRYLWAHAGFNRWYPSMQGKRSYAVVRKFLLQSCQQIRAKGLRISERVFIPEPFDIQQAAAIAERHRQALSALMWTEGESRFKMMIAIGELKELRTTALGFGVVLKHLPERQLLLAQAAGERAKRTFEDELAAWSVGGMRLIVACLIFARNELCLEVQSLAIMMTDAHWIPLDSVAEKALIDKLVTAERTFIKPVRYGNAEVNEGPTVQLLDAGPGPRPLDMVGAFLNANERAAKLRRITSRGAPTWIWDAARDSIPPELPPRSSRLSNSRGNCLPS